MPVVLKCPVCGSANLKETTSANLTLVGPPPATINYRCDQGHYFFVTINAPKVKDAAASGE